MNQVIIGLAGHIDHGKTTLVEGLTGVNTDRMKEEIQRGMTIDIGFAFLSEKVTLIDVPGHERFVKNMMTGVSSVDAAILVIAADDGVMPQTREHLDILTLLGVKKGCIVLNKIDLVDKEWIDLVELDIQDLVKTSFLKNASLIRVSAIERIGINLLKKEIQNICNSIEEKTDRGIFRMPVDRVFIKRGFGTVITGTIASGSLEKGKTIEILPSGINAKVRGLQSHGKHVNNVTIGDRAAVNFQGLDAGKIYRGCQIASPGYFVASKKIGAFIKMLDTLKKPITQNQRIRIHIGTQEVMARISLLDMVKLLPGGSSSVMLKLESPITASIGDKFIIRSYSPITTIAGGEIIDNQVSGKWTTIKTYLKNIYHTELGLQIPFMIETFGSKPMTKEKMKLKFGYSESNFKKNIDNYSDIFWVRINRDEWLVTKNQIINLKEVILEYLKDFHRKYPYKEGLQREEIRQYLDGEDRFIEFILFEMLNEGSISKNGENWALADHSIQLSSSEKIKLEMLLKTLDEEGFYSSNQKELAQNMGISEDEVKLLLEVGNRLEKIIRIDGKLLFTKKNFMSLKQKLIKYFQNNELMSVSEFKAITGTSRKYAVPLLEYFDKLKITYRDGNNRKIIQGKNVEV